MHIYILNCRISLSSDMLFIYSLYPTHFPRNSSVPSCIWQPFKYSQLSPLQAEHTKLLEPFLIELGFQTPSVSQLGISYLLKKEKGVLWHHEDQEIFKYNMLVFKVCCNAQYKFQIPLQITLDNLKHITAGNSF